MEDALLSPLRAWESYYVIVGSSGAALTGLQFVVIALAAESRSGGSSQIDAFGTPTTVHFGAVLLIAAILSAPWHSLNSAALALGVAGLAGLVYAAIVVRRARAQTGYKPVLEDWLFHAAFPIACYGALFGGAVALPRYPEDALFALAAAALGLLFIGIHNAWDTVTYIAITQREARAKKDTGRAAAAGADAPAATAPRPPEPAAATTEP
ncbi:MAG TPA: hypothetical protein VFJ74_17770 [Gemmatimonadaceae bacterium]|nr:hypothetical protein [Gemmatimonadaceae bacterium]